MIDEITIIKSNIDKAIDIIDEHVSSLSFPMDSYLEDLLATGNLYEMKLNENTFGYFIEMEKTLQFFHITKSYYRDAPTILEKVVCDFNIEKISVISQDPQIVALMVEWDYDRERMGCWFIDSNQEVDRTNKIPNAVFRTATLSD